MSTLPQPHDDNELPTERANLKITLHKVGEISSTYKSTGDKSGGAALMGSAIGTGAFIVVAPGATLGAARVHLSIATATAIVALQLFGLGLVFVTAVVASRRRRRKRK